MADEKKEEVKKEEGGETKKKNNLILFIIIGVLVLLLVIVGVVAMLLMGGEEEKPQDPAVAAGVPADGDAPKVAAKPKIKSDLTAIGQMHPMDQVIVNLLTQSGRRYLKVAISFELSAEPLATEMDSKKAVIRDIVISVLSSKTIEEISTSKGKEKLKEEVIAKVNEILVDGQIKNLFFTDFVIQ